MTISMEGRKSRAFQWLKSPERVRAEALDVIKMPHRLRITSHSAVTQISMSQSRVLMVIAGAAVLSSSERTGANQ
jgi:hypothetical protein